MMPAVASNEKRVVVQHPSGLWQILDAVEEQPPDLVEARFSLGTIRERLVPLNLVAVKPRYYLFRVVGHSRTKMMPHPEQV